MLEVISLSDLEGVFSRQRKGPNALFSDFTHVAQDGDGEVILFEGEPEHLEGDVWAGGGYGWVFSLGYFEVEEWWGVQSADCVAELPIATTLDNV